MNLIHEPSLSWTILATTDALKSETKGSYRSIHMCDMSQYQFLRMKNRCFDKCNCMRCMEKEEWMNE